jgi:hypothetical protein
MRAPGKFGAPWVDYPDSKMATARTQPTTQPGSQLLTPAQAIPPGGAINGPVVSSAAAPPSEQLPAKNADILRSVYQSLKEGDECQSPTDYCYNTQN